jgi:hypothetical protein
MKLSRAIRSKVGTFNRSFPFSWEQLRALNKDYDSSSLKPSTDYRLTVNGTSNPFPGHDDHTLTLLYLGLEVRPDNFPHNSYV